MICGVHEIGPVVLTDVERVDPDGLGEDGLLDRVADDDVTVERLAGLVEAHVGGRSPIRTPRRGRAAARAPGALARVGRRTAKTSMSPGGLRPCHLIALKLLSGRGPASQQGAGGRAEPGSEQRRRTAQRARGARADHAPPRSRRPPPPHCRAVTFGRGRARSRLRPAPPGRGRPAQRPERRREGHALRPAYPRGRCQVTSMRRCRRIARQPRLIQQTHRQQPSAANVACRRNR